MKTLYWKAELDLGLFLETIQAAAMPAISPLKCPSQETGIAVGNTPLNNPP
jgi:hypothetical protein